MPRELFPPCPLVTPLGLGGTKVLTLFNAKKRLSADVVLLE